MSQAKPKFLPTRKKRTSLLIRLSAVYFLLMLVNLSVFWIATGSNQFRLIKDKVLLQGDLYGERLLSKITNLKDASANQPNFSTLVSPLALQHPDLKSFDWLYITDTSGAVLDKTKGLGKEKTNSLFPHVIKSSQLREMTNRSFLAVPDLSEFEIAIFIPFKQKKKELVLAAGLPIPFMGKELNTLIYMAIGIVSILTVFQIAFGIYFFRRVIRPIKKTADAMGQLTKGKITRRLHLPSVHDELYLMVDGFNHMNAALHRRKVLLRKALKRIRKRNKVMLHELGLAQEVQTGLLYNDQSHSMIDFGLTYLPLMKVSGDYYEICRLKDGSLVIALADASGHGVPAALMTAMAKANFNLAFESEYEPSAILSKVHDVFIEKYATDSYFTVGLLVLDHFGCLHYSMAAHPSPYVLKKETSQLITLDSATGLPLGIIPTKLDYTQNKQQLENGDRVVIFSDGITEQANTNGEQFGTQRLEQLIFETVEQSAQEACQAITQAVKDFQGAASTGDDITLLVIDFVETRIPVKANMENARIFFDRAVRLYEEHDYYRSFLIFKRLLRIYPDSEKIGLYISELLTKLKRYLFALRVLKALSQSERYAYISQLRMGFIFVKLGKDSEAELCFSKALTINPKSPAGHSGMSIIEFRKKEYSSSQNWYDKINDEMKQNSTLLQKVGTALNKVGSR